MASITYDGQSFLVDGRRIWLAGGTINYTNVPRALWALRIHQARAAGLNTITTSVHWARHEPRPAQFDFAEGADLKHFVSLVGQAGMYCILRMGPYVGAGFDLGGLPPWLALQKDVALRTNSAPYLEAASRFFGAVAKQVRDLQASAPEASSGGPILLIQNEIGWTCGHDALAHSYLGELNRYLRESGFDVPIINANDLWAGVEGEIDSWSGSGEMLPNMRQLATVRPLQPRLVSGVRVGRAAVWGAPVPGPMDGETLQRTLCEILAGAGQFNIEPFHGGTHFGFWAGRHEAADASEPAGTWMLTTSNDQSAPIDEAGRPTPLLPHLRRVALFASRFGRVLSGLEHRRYQVALRPGSISESPAGAKSAPGGHVVVHASGSQGSVVFVFGPPVAARAKSPDQPANLLLSDGSSLPVHLGRNPVAWCLLDVRLVGRSHLDYCNLSAIALVGRVLVVTGPAGSPGRLSINGAPLETEVPTGDQPAVLEHEGVVVVVCADDHLPRVQVADNAVYLNAVGFSLAGIPQIASKDDTCTRIGDDGVSAMLRLEDLKPPKAKKGQHAPPPPQPRVELAPSGRTPPAPALGEWTGSTAHDYADGSSARYASIQGPADLTALGAPYGYGWYRIALKGSEPRRAHLAWPQGSDRLHIFVDGHYQGLLGEGPGAKDQISLNLTKHPQTLVVLVENAGRLAAGNRVGHATGLLGHGWEVEPLRLSRPTLERAEPFEPLSFKSPILRVSQGDVTDSSRLVWSVNRRGRQPLLLTLAPTPFSGVLFVNDTPTRWFDAHAPLRLYLDEAALGRGNLSISIAVMGSAEAALKPVAEALTGQECIENLTAKADWSFAKWERPPADHFKPWRSSRHDGPVWCRTTFVTRPGAPSCRIICAGLSKGQVYVNNRHLGRYFTSTAAHHDVGPQTGLFCPGAWLNPDKPNDLIIFDEHGLGPSKVRVQFEV